MLEPRVRFDEPHCEGRNGEATNGRCCHQSTATAAFVPRPRRARSHSISTAAGVRRRDASARLRPPVLLRARDGSLSAVARIWAHIAPKF